jgi:hypothetical protein
MLWVSAKFAPRLPTDDQNYNDFPSVQLFKAQMTMTVFGGNVIASGETWVYCSDIETK